MLPESFGAATRAWFEASFPTPTRVQREGWPAIAGGENALLLAPTGSGKTLAAFLACIDRLARLPADAPPGVRVLYVSPLKALANDIERNLRAPLVGIAHTAARLGVPHRPLRVDVRTGDTPARDRRRQARDPGDILVTTPESLYLLLTSDAREALDTVETIIVDEIHTLAGTKRGVHLALSLERLAARTARDPQRVGLSATQRPLDEIARFLSGQRPTRLVDTSEPPRVDLRVVVPVPDMERPVGEGNQLADGLWPTIYPKLLELIRAHRSTIVFVNSRLLCERLAQKLNDLAGEELVRAHHGSVSHAQRAVVEELLKAGELPGIVATSSLELGIDMGAVDLVVLVESPGSASRGLQRIGRAGHAVGERSVGRLFPKHRGDLVEAAVLARHMREGRVEATSVPRNCLDVLAQQVVAMVAMEPVTVDALHALVRRTHAYRDLSRPALESVLDMLSGRYPSDDFGELAPRIVWDRATDELTPRRGARKLAVLNAGTIPDRGAYGVFVAPEGPRVGELDEEMVYETRKGDLVILGASTWRVEEITRDRVLVSPAPGQPGRLPFWHGDRPGRPIEVGRAIGAFLRELVERPDPEPWLREEHALDAHAVTNLLAFVADQRERAGAVPSDRSIVVERFRDELGDWRTCILSPFGSRVHAPWTLAIQARLRARLGLDVPALYTEDGIVLRFPDVEEVPPLEDLLPDPEEIEALVLEELRFSPLFASRFRENAGRALLLPRQRFDGRTPLWAQRLKSESLLKVASRFPSFPLILETCRECLQDVFDLPALTELLRGVRSREVAVHEVETPRPSPFARSLVFAWVGTFVYELEAPLAERRAQALALDRELLRDLLGETELRELLDPGAVAEVDAELQHLDPDRRARHADAVHDLLRRLGELSADEIAQRSAEDPSAWLAALERQRRIVPIRLAGVPRFVAVEDAARYRDALGVALPPGLPAAFVDAEHSGLEGLLLRHARSRGPFRVAPLAARWGLPAGALEAVARALEARDELVHDAILPGGEGSDWCHPDVLRRLRRRSLAKLRDEIAPVEAPVYARFLLELHGVGAKRAGVARLEEAIAQLEGVALPWSDLVERVLPARVPGFSVDLLDQLGAMGSIAWVGAGALGPRDGRVMLFRRARAPMVLDPAPPAALEGLPAAVDAHLRARGACFLVELQAATGAPLPALIEALWDLVWAGRATNDTFGPLRSLRARRRSRDAVPGGRWSTVDALRGPPPSDTERAHARALRLLERHGVVSAASAQAEDLPGGFSAVYPVLRAMEESGKVRRGLFVEGVGGAQFAAPGAVDRLRAWREGPGEVVVLATTDPANPWGGVLPWPPHAEGLRPRRAAGTRVVLVDARPVLFLEGRSVVTFTDDPELLARAVDAAPSRSWRIDRIDGRPATEAPLAEVFRALGFAAGYRSLERAARPADRG